MVEVDPNVLVGLLGIGVAIGAGIFGYMIKNARCLIRIETIQKGQGSDIDSIKKKLGIQDNQINALDKKVAVLDHQVNED